MDAKVYVYDVGYRQTLEKLRIRRILNGRPALPLPVVKVPAGILTYEWLAIIRFKTLEDSIRYLDVLATVIKQNKKYKSRELELTVFPPYKGGLVKTHTGTYVAMVYITSPLMHWVRKLYMRLHQIPIVGFIKMEKIYRVPKEHTRTPKSVKF